MNRRVFVADHRPDRHGIYRHVRHRGLEERFAELPFAIALEACDRIGEAENIPEGPGRRAALRRASGIPKKDFSK